MLGSHLPKILRNAFFVLGMVMITMAGAMEELEGWNQPDHNLDPSECQVARQAPMAASHG